MTVPSAGAGGHAPRPPARSASTEEEFERLRKILGRDPNWTELGITSALWSEHCSYKSSKIYLREFPTEGPHVLQGPGENAGVVDIGHGWVAVFKMESHNHPSFIEPYQGSMTGVGGILRDIFTMGARPIACHGLAALRRDRRAAHALPDRRRGARHRRLRQLLRRPHRRRRDRLPPLLQRQHPGQRLRPRASPGATASSTPGRAAPATRSSTSAAAPAATASTAPPWPPSRSTRRASRSGRPCRWAIRSPRRSCSRPAWRRCAPAPSWRSRTWAPPASTSSTFEMAGRGGTGLRLDLDHVPLREAGLTPYEMMLSESQERMVLVAPQGAGGGAGEGLPPLGAGGGEHRRDHRHRPRRPRSGTARRRPTSRSARSPRRRPSTIGRWPSRRDLAARWRAPEVPQPEDLRGTLERLLATPEFASKAWIYHAVRPHRAHQHGAGPGRRRRGGPAQGDRPPASP